MNGEGSRFEEIVGNIVQATNWQNEITASDLRSNDAEQVRIEREVRRLNYQYLRKRQSKAEIRRLYGVHAAFQVKKEELARSVCACEYDPLVVRLGAERLFEMPYYTQIFDGRPVREYLTYVHLNRAVRYSSRGKPEWGYARWLVVHHSWNLLKGTIGGDAGRRKFLKICELRSENWRLRYLDRFVEASFRAAMAFFRKKRGKGETALDVSSFFKRIGRGDEFEKYWQFQAHSFRKPAIKALKRFQRELANVAEQ